MAKKSIKKKERKFQDFLTEGKDYNAKQIRKFQLAEKALRRKIDDEKKEIKKFILNLALTVYYKLYADTLPKGSPSNK